MGERMTKEKKLIEHDRRGFLKLASVSAVLGSAAAVASPGVAQAAVEEAWEEGRYHETDHVKRYYDLARF
jgi:hypothetical protein